MRLYTCNARYVAHIRAAVEKAVAECKRQDALEKAYAPDRAPDYAVDAQLTGQDDGTLFIMVGGVNDTTQATRIFDTQQYAIPDAGEQTYALASTAH
jgi:hypothetical protein